MSTKWILITAILLILGAGCGNNHSTVMLDRAPYADGPHVFIADSNYAALQFEYNEDGWTTSKAIYSPPFQISFGNPFFDSLKCTIEAVASEQPSHRPERGDILVLSDLEGNYDAFIKLCLAGKVISKNGDWQFGQNHLVILGDLQDRGEDVTPLMWHIYRLEMQAQLVGGSVHVLLGNHEEMVFDGDHRYLHQKYRAIEQDCSIRYADLYSTSTVLGRWLRRKNVVEVIGNRLFAHGGISPAVQQLELSLEKMNELLRRNRFRSPMSAIEQKSLKVLLGSSGPLWNRIWTEAPPKETVLDEILSYYGVDQMIIGHTLVPEVYSIHHDKLVFVDVDHRHGHTARALLIKDESLFTLDQYGDVRPIRTSN